MRILYLDLDTLRPDHLHCYGYQRATSPNIDAIAEEGIRFDNYYCSDAPCLPSRTALTSGRFGIHTGVVGHDGTAADMRLEGAARSFMGSHRFSSLPWTLRQKGLHTVSISPFAERHGSWTFNAGFDEMHNTGKCGMESAEEVTPTALDWLGRNACQDNWFLQVNYWDPHTPYRAPQSFGNPFKDDPLPSWLTDEVLAAHWQMAGPHTAQEVSMYDNGTNPRYPRQPGEVRGREGLRQVIDGYDCGIRYMDGHIGQLFDAIRAAGVWNDLVIMISADHGENLGELGIYGEHATSDYITHRIPMIVRIPGGPRGKADKGLRYNLDLLPTLAEWLQLPKSAQWDGRSYAKIFNGQDDPGHPYLVLGQCAHVCQRSVRFGPWQYIRTYHDGFHLFPKEMLFDVATDPHEQHNLAGKLPEVCRQAVYYLNEWHDEMMLTMPDAIDPMWTVMREGGPCHAREALRGYGERLKATGRGAAADELKRRHPSEFR